MFDGFLSRYITVTDTTIHTVIGGDGPPLLLLHGYPQTHVCWRKVAPVLAEQFSVVAADLRGYGASGKPPSDEADHPYSKRTMARDMVEVMTELGFDRFFVAGHDRGGRVAYRLALDHSERVERLATLDIMPTYASWRLIRGTGGVNVYHWFFLAQPHPLPERLIGSDPAFFLRWTLGSWSGGGSLPPSDAIEQEALAAYEQAFSEPEMMRATCDDYRAGATIDVDIDQADVDAGRKIGCPMLVLWGDRDGIVPSELYVDTWSELADDIRGQAVPCGHFLPEEAPQETFAALRDFFGEPS